MNQNTNQYMAEESIGKLMLRFSIPCIMSLLVSALYNIVDQIFIGRGIGFLGNGATNVVFPVTVIALSLSLLVGDGCAAYLSICQGRRDGNMHTGAWALQWSLSLLPESFSPCCTPFSETVSCGGSAQQRTT